MEEYTLRLTAEDLEVISKGLGELKFAVAAPVFSKVNGQIAAQQQAQQQMQGKKG